MLSSTSRYLLSSGLFWVFLYLCDSRQILFSKRSDLRQDLSLSFALLLGEVEANGRWNHGHGKRPRCIISYKDAE